MYRIDNPTASPTLPAPSAPGVNPESYWTGGDPTTGMLATRVDAEWLNMVQEEIANCITEGLNKAQRNQLLMAIRREVSAAGGGGTAPPLPPLTTLTVNQPHTAPISSPSMVMTPVCNFTLHSGNWELWGVAGFTYSAGTNSGTLRAIGAGMGVGINNDWVAGITGLSTQIVANTYVFPNSTQVMEFYAGHAVINLNADTQIFLLARPDFDNISVGAYGFMQAQLL